MTDLNASSSEMRWAGRPGDLRQEADEPMLDMILDGQPLPPTAPHRMTVLAEKLADLAGPAQAGELTGEAAALSAFSRSVRPASAAPLAGRTPSHRLRRRPGNRRATLAAAIAAAGFVIVGTAATYTGELPATLQGFAHRVIDAPAPHVTHGHHRGEDQRPGRSGTAPGHTGQTPSHGRGNGKGKAEHGQRARRGKPAARQPNPVHPTHPPTPAPRHAKG